MKLGRISLALFILLFAWTGCEQSTELDNHAPEISEILVNYQQISINQTVSVTAVATDGDGDSLSYYWSTSAGGINSYDITSNPTKWYTPDTPGEYTVTCIVSDGKETATKSITISVN